MRQPIYFISGKTNEQLKSKGLPDVEKFKELGLGHLVADLPNVKFAWNQIVNNGPGSNAGTLVTYEAQGQDEGKRRPIDMGYKPTIQEWQIADKDNGVWIGTWKEGKPEEKDLRRFHTFGNWLVDIGGNKYQVPFIRRTDGKTELPSDLKVCPYREVIKPQYVDIWERTGKAFDWLAELAPADCKYFSEEMGVMLALDCLALNYRVGPFEQNAFALFDSTNWIGILYAMLDSMSIEEVVDAKKKESQSTQLELANSSHGQKEDCPATAQLEASCT